MLIALCLILPLTALSARADSKADDTTFTDKATAVVRILNKAAGRAESITIPVGGSGEYEKLTINVKTCKVTPQFAALDNWMFAQIEKSGARVFSGWMSMAEPGENPFRDADYDVWLIKCE